MLSVFYGMHGTSVVTKPNVVAGLVQLNRHRLTMLRRGEPRVSRHGKTWHYQYRLRGSAVDRKVSNWTCQAKHRQDVAIFGCHSEGLPVVLKLADGCTEGRKFLVVILTSGIDRYCKQSSTQNKRLHDLNIIIS